MNAHSRRYFTSLTSSERIGIGATPWGDTAFTGEIGEVLVYAAILSAAEQEALSKRLMAKWGIQ